MNPVILKRNPDSDTMPNHKRSIVETPYEEVTNTLFSKYRQSACQEKHRYAFKEIDYNC